MTSNLREITPQKSLTLKIASTAIFTAIGVVLSYLNPFAYTLIFGAKINPFVHMINAIAGVLLGPWFALLTALLIAIIRFSTGIGTILAFPGGLSGAIIVGLLREILLKFKSTKIHFAAFVEPLGTVLIGASISSFLVPTPIWTLMWLFSLSCVPGCILGFITLQIIQKYGISIENFQVSRNSLKEVHLNVP